MTCHGGASLNSVAIDAERLQVHADDTPDHSPSTLQTGKRFVCGPCPVGWSGNGTHCSACPISVSIPLTTADGFAPGIPWVIRGQPLTLFGSVEVLPPYPGAQCNFQGGFAFAWSAATRKGRIPIQLFQSSTRTLFVPPRSLAENTEAEFELLVCYGTNSDPALCGKAVRTVGVRRSELVPVLDGAGSALSTGDKNVITLDCSRSVDPDDPGNELAPMQFRWECANLRRGGEDCSGVANLTAGFTSPVQARGRKQRALLCCVLSCAFPGIRA